MSGAPAASALRRLAEPAGTHIAHHRKPGGAAANARTRWKRETPPTPAIVIERQRLGKMAFDIPERFLGWIHD